MTFLWNPNVIVAEWDAQTRTFLIPYSSSCSFPLLLTSSYTASCFLPSYSTAFSHACQPTLHLTHVLAECQFLSSLVCWWVSPSQGWQLHFGLSALPGHCNTSPTAMTPRLQREKKQRCILTVSWDTCLLLLLSAPLPLLSWHQKSEASQNGKKPEEYPYPSLSLGTLPPG